VKKAKAHAKQLDQAWSSFEAQGIAAGGASEAAAFNLVVREVRATVTAQDFAALETAASGVLDQVDGIERVFAP
jgi:hypothetical protein